MAYVSLGFSWWSVRRTRLCHPHLPYVRDQETNTHPESYRLPNLHGTASNSALVTRMTLLVASHFIQLMRLFSVGRHRQDSRLVILCCTRHWGPEESDKIHKCVIMNEESGWKCYKTIATYTRLRIRNQNATCSTIRSQLPPREIHVW